jgi:hypothetical protein
VTTSRQPTAFVRDDNGGEHIVTTIPAPSQPGNVGRIDYLTKLPGKAKWTSHTIPDLLVPLAGKVQVEAHLSPDARRVVVVFYRCDGVYTADASLTQTRLPAPTQVISADNCDSPTSTVSNTPVAKAITLYGREIGVLLPDATDPGKYAVYAGTPGDTTGYAPITVLPTTDDFVPLQIVRDVSSGAFVAVGEGSDGTNEGIYVTSQAGSSDTWTPPRQVATLNSPTKDYTVDSLTSYHRQTWVGLSKPAGGKYRLYFAHLTSTNQLISGRVPHATAKDNNLRLSINQETGNVHAAWTRVVTTSKTGKSGIMHEYRKGGNWSRPTFLTHWYHDVATQLAFTAAGHVVIGYEQK